MKVKVSFPPASEYRKLMARKLFFILGFVCLIIILSGIAVTVGPMEFSSKEAFKAVLERFFPSRFSVSGVSGSVIWMIRLPRIITALLAGFGLAIAGVQMQAILRNPLASPFTLGISAGGGFGASLAILMGVGFAGGEYFLIGNAFLFSLIPALLIFFLSRFKKATAGMMILAGISLAYIFSAGSTLISYFAQAEDLKALSLWMMGDVGKTTWADLGPMAAVMLTSSVFLLLASRTLNIMNAGDETAKSLGVNVERVRISIVVLSSLVTSSVICFTGMIGFVGLVAPHITRMFIGSDNRFLVPASGLFGAAFLLGADIVSMTVIEPSVLPVGLVTALLGGPLFFLLIIGRKGREYW
ncbi:MAG: iron chelate uptake ABC transporter family permease subunit [Candidatus Omnitrophica bacterium]|nr:iron chelate uptake ABC transporter family permease subunit [Candidatus Omnitrophota bacterium]